MKNISEPKRELKNNFLFLRFFSVVLFLCALVFTNNSFASTSRNLTVFAEPNMALALTKIARLYSQKSNVIVSVNSSPSTDLISDIDSGEPADVFISAHHGSIETLRQKGLIDVYNIGFIATDKLVLITSKSNLGLFPELQVKTLILEEVLRVLDNKKATLIIDYDGNSSGNFSANLVSRLNLHNIKLFNKLAEDKTPIFSLIKNSPEHYALLLASQIKNDPDFEILAEKKDSKIFYQALVIAGDNMEIAREFLEFLKSDAAKKILEQSGFGNS